MKKFCLNAVLPCLAAFLLFCSANSSQAQSSKKPEKEATKVPSNESLKEKNFETATFGGGCFWCVEAVFQRVDGVAGVVSGYAGGQVENPTYKAVCTGRTGHAEVCQITFDPSIVSFEQMLAIFLKSHDPTTWVLSIDRWFFIMMRINAWPPRMSSRSSKRRKSLD